MFKILHLTACGLLGLCLSTATQATEPLALIYSQAKIQHCQDIVVQAFSTETQTLEPGQCAMQQIQVSNTSSHALKELAVKLPIPDGIHVMPFKKGQWVKVASHEGELPKMRISKQQDQLQITIPEIAPNSNLTLWAKFKIR
jgi:hypothetical protein